MRTPIKLTVASRGPELLPKCLDHDPLPGVAPQAYREIAYTDPRDGIERHLPQPQPSTENFAPLGPCALFMSMWWNAQTLQQRESDLTALELDALNAAVAILDIPQQEYNRRQHPHKDWTPLSSSGEKK